MTEFTTLLETENLCLYTKDFGNNHENVYDCVKFETVVSGKVYCSKFSVDMNNYNDMTLLDTLQYYHVTKFNDLVITEYPTMEIAKRSEGFK